MKIILASVALLAFHAWPQNAFAGASKLTAGLGHDLAKAKCSSCHLIEPGQSNPADHVGGPAFQTVADQPGISKAMLRKHLKTTHAGKIIPLGMPNPQLTPDELTKVIDYLLSLRPPAGPQDR